MANAYQLYMGPINNDVQQSINFNLSNTNFSSTSIVVKNGSADLCEVSMAQFKLRKKVYKPGHLELLLNITPTADERIETVLTTLFATNPITLTKTVGKNELEIAKRYIVLDYSYSENGASDYLVTLDAYSPDKLLTLNKGFHTYTGRKLYNDILKPTDSVIWPDDYKKLKVPLKVNLHYMKYKSKLMVEACIDSNGDGVLDKDGSDYAFIKDSTGSANQKFNFGREYISPYLVQYNECTFNFLARVLNSCGEYFYYEKGCLMVGWIEPRLLDIMPKSCLCKAPDSNESNLEEKLAYDPNFFSFDLYKSRLEADATKVKDKLTEFPIKIETALMSKKKSFFVGVGTENPSSIDVCTGRTMVSENADDFCNWEDFAIFPGGFLVGTITNALKAPTLSKMLSSGLQNAAVRSIFAEERQRTTTDEVRDKYFPKAEEPENDNSGKQVQGTHYFEEQCDDFDKDDTKIYFYRTSPNVVDSDYYPLMDIKNNVFSQEYYTRIRSMMNKVEEGRISLDLGTADYELLLGSLCSYGGSHYIVESVNETLEPDGESYARRCKVDLVPYKVYYKGTEDDKGAVFPPRVDSTLLSTGEASPQMAVVTNNLDPDNLSRVTVNFHKLNVENHTTSSMGSDDSPWLSIAWPMASNETGFNMLPNEGDIAIVNYLEHNPAYPYVEGFVYDKDHKANMVTHTSVSKSITSTNGHSIIFYDPRNSGSDFLSNIIGGPWSLLTSLTPAFSFSLGEDSDALAGGITLTDKNEIYTISMSTDQRLITINSALGKVDISAFEGITISAPNGNVNIEGKNVAITAGNNLTLTSGTNISNEKGHSVAYIEHNKEAWRQEGIAFGSGLLDLSFLRHFLEVFARPIGGKLLISSNRDLWLEAGQKKIDKRKKDVRQEFNQSYKDIAEYIDNFWKHLNSVCTEWGNNVNDANTTLRTLKGAYKALEKEIDKKSKEAACDADDLGNNLPDIKDVEKITLKNDTTYVKAKKFEAEKVEKIGPDKGTQTIELDIELVSAYNNALKAYQEARGEEGEKDKLGVKYYENSFQESMNGEKPQHGEGEKQKKSIYDKCTTQVVANVIVAIKGNAYDTDFKPLSKDDLETKKQEILNDHVLKSLDGYGGVVVYKKKASEESYNDVFKDSISLFESPKAQGRQIFLEGLGFAGFKDELFTQNDNLESGGILMTGSDGTVSGLNKNALTEEKTKKDIEAARNEVLESLGVTVDNPNNAQIVVQPRE